MQRQTKQNTSQDTDYSLKMKTNNEVANFFWHGNPLSLYEQKCILSYVKHDWNVKLWTFGNVEPPNGVELCDANTFFKVEDIQTFVQKKKVGCIAAFSDAFRYTMLQRTGGWWFDTDCFCLKNQREFLKLKEGRHIIVGRESSEIIAVGVLSFIDPLLAEKSVNLLNKILETRNRRVGWGEIGPRLITQLVNENGLQDDALPTNYFYPLTPKQALNALDPTRLIEVEDKCSNSYVYHYWSEMLSRASVNKNELPPVGSFLYKKFTE